MNSDSMKRTCIYLLNEVDVEASLLYQKDTLFGYAVKPPRKVGYNNLIIYDKNLFGGPEYRGQPVANLSNLWINFLYNPVLRPTSGLDRAELVTSVQHRLHCFQQNIIG